MCSFSPTNDIKDLEIKQRLTTGYTINTPFIMQGNNNNMRFSENETFSTLRTFNKQAHSSNRKKLSLIKKGNNLLNRLKLEAVD
jgi:hypothetical protein